MWAQIMVNVKNTGEAALTVASPVFCIYSDFLNSEVLLFVVFERKSQK